MDITELHLSLAENINPILAYKPGKYFPAQQDAVREKFCELIRMPRIKGKEKPVPVIEWEDNSDERYDEIRFTFESEPGYTVPAHAILPKNREGKLATVICLQGHSAGMHVSLGRAGIGTKELAAEVKGDRDFAIWAVARGYAAIIMEQRGFGERASTISKSCNMAFLQALAIGRTLIGERIFDVKRLIDALESFDFVDFDKLGIMGNSSGGTTSFYAAAMEERIKVVMPSCCFGKFTGSWLKYEHCTCGFIPDFFKWFDMPDIALAIAPRKMVIVAGESDSICDVDSVRSAFENTVKPIYAEAGVPDNCRLIVGPEGHRFYADLAWPVFDELIGK